MGGGLDDEDEVEADEDVEGRGPGESLESEGAFGEVVDL